MYCVRHIYNPGELCLSSYRQTYSSISTLRHIHIYWGIIKAYSRLFRHIQHSLQPSHIRILSVFRTLAYLELEAYSKHSETLKRHLQNSTIVKTVYSGIIQSYSGIIRTLCNACICRNLAFLELWNIHYPSIIVSHRIFRTLSYFQIGKSWWVFC